MSWLRSQLVRLFSWAAKRLFDIALLLRLFSLVLEREATRSGSPRDADEAQRRIDDGAAWLDFCDSLRGLVDFVVAPSPAPLPDPAGAGAGAGAGGAAGSSGSLLPQQQLEGPGSRAPASSSASSEQEAVATAAAVQLDSLDRREGLRYLTRVLRAGLEAFMDCWDPAWPVLRPLPYNVKLGADNPDNLYMYGTVSGSYEYRLYGTRGTVTYLSFGCYSGSRPGQGSSRPTHLDSSQLLVTADGSFEIFLTPQPRGGNWMRLPPDASRLVVRQTFLNRSAEAAAQVTIERLPGLAETVARAGGGGGGGGAHARGGGGGSGGGGAAGLSAVAAEAVGASGAASVPQRDAAGREVKPPLSAGQVVSGLAGAAVFIAGSVRQFQSWSRSFAMRPNTLFALDHDVYMSAWADPAIHFLHGYWRLGTGEALLIQAKPPDCPYWNFQVDNWWMESLDYVAHPETTTNKATASYMPDGSICLVVARCDPRVSGNDGAAVAEGGNEGLAALLPPALLAGVTWLSTAHHVHGTMGLRWVLAKEHPVPRCRVVALGRPLAEAIADGVAAAVGP